MLRMCAWVAVLAVMCHSVIGQDDEDFPAEWEAKAFPNPLRNPDHCNLGPHKGFICDPNRMLQDREVELLNWLLRGFYNNDTVCPCSTYWCERTKKGSHLSVAIVRKLKLAETFDAPDTAVMQAASNFALRLQESYWNFGQCDNDIVILYSVEDGVLFISYGKTIRQVMDNRVVNHIQRLHGYNFKQGGDLFVGLVHLILSFRQVLNGYDHYNPDSPHFEQLVGDASHMTSGILATSSLALLSTVWSRL